MLKTFPTYLDGFIIAAMRLKREGKWEINVDFLLTLIFKKAVTFDTFVM